jgi:hypothetical protein
MRECSESRFAFATEGRREMVAEFNGGSISSDGGALLLGEAGSKTEVDRAVQSMLSGWPQPGSGRAPNRATAGATDLRAGAGV